MENSPGPGQVPLSGKSHGRAFRAKFAAILKTKNVPPDQSLTSSLFKKGWVVSAKRPFGNPAPVIEHLGRYAHKAAVPGHRIKNTAPDQVAFSYKGYRHGEVKKEVGLAPIEFIRRLALHVLPRSFVRVRHFGTLGPTAKKASIPIVQQQFGQKARVKKESPKVRKYNALLCPCCHAETMATIGVLPKRGPPDHAVSMKMAIQKQQGWGQAGKGCALEVGKCPLQGLMRLKRRCNVRNKPWWAATCPA